MTSSSKFRRIARGRATELRKKVTLNARRVRRSAIGSPVRGATLDRAARSEE